MKRIALFCIIILTLAIAGCQSLEMVPEAEGPGHPGYEFTDRESYRYFAVTRGGHYNIELSFREGTLNVGLNDMDITIQDKDGRNISGARVSIIPIMKNLGSGVDTSASVNEQMDGTYSARRVDIPMPGLWQLKVRVSSLMINDEATFDFRVETGSGMMGTMFPAHHMFRAGEVGSTRAESARGLFNVSYEAPFPIPLNRSHSWDIRINTQRRASVTGARVTVSGGMPARGYALPTRPVVVDTGFPGRYRIDRLKFTEPGEWVVRLHIDDGFDNKDTAEFIFRVN
ncbi:FixH family protein [Nitrospirota bacterium]